MPGFDLGIHDFRRASRQDVDCRVKPGNDESG